MHISPEFHCSQSVAMIAELAERSPIIIQNGSSNPSSRKNLDLRPYDRPYKVLLLTCVVNCTAGTPTPRLCSVVQWSVHWAPSCPGQGKVLYPWDVQEKKMRAPLLGLAKSIYYHINAAFCTTKLISEKVLLKKNLITMI